MNANKRPLMHYSDGGITADVELPELDDSYTAERPTPEMIERASEALISAFPQTVNETPN